MYSLFDLPIQKNIIILKELILRYNLTELI